MPPVVWIIAGLAAVGVFILSRETAEAAAPESTFPGGVDPSTFPSAVTLPDTMPQGSDITVYSDSRTRGERNNNPGNVRYNQADQWRGLVGHDDKGFCIFSDYPWGIRCVTVLMRRYYYDYQLDTVRELINRYAPPAENDTSSYVHNVALYLGVDPDDTLDVEANMQGLVTAIIQQENGRVKYSRTDIANGISLA